MENMSSLKRNLAFQSVDSSKISRITPSQWGVLMLIDRCGEISTKDIAHTLQISSSATTQLVDGLVENGYVTREEQAKDRRVILLALSKKTKKQVEKMKKQMVQKFLEIFEVLDDKEFNQYHILHNKIVQRFSKKLK